MYKHHPAQNSVVFLMTELMYVEFFKYRIDKHDIEMISYYVYDDAVSFEELIIAVRLTIIDVFKLRV
jgi:hypothetical protein